MDQDKRVIVAFALSFVMLVAWRVLFVKPAPPVIKPPLSATAPRRSQPGAPAPVPSEGKGLVAASGKDHGKSAMQSQPGAAPSLPIQQGSKAEDIVVENDLYKVTLSSQGAVVKSWVLKKYKDENGDLLELVNLPACETLGYPMSLVVSDPSQTLKANSDLGHKVNTALFVGKATQLVATSVSKEKHLPQAPVLASPFTAPINLEFTYSDGTVLVHKKFSFGHGYQVHVEVSVSDGQHDYPVGVEWPGGFGDNSLAVKIREASREAFYGTAQDITAVAQAKVKEDQPIPVPLGVMGLEDKFFADVFLPYSDSAPFTPDVAFRFVRQPWNPPDWKEKELPQSLMATLSSSAPQPLAFRLFVGPKALDVLGGVKPSLEGMVSFGWFTIIAKPLFLGLRYIYDNWVHNYGWAIVLLTCLINFAMFPLKVKSIRSAQNMQKIAPLVKDIQDRYKQYKFNDPRKQRMNAEVMELYKKHGVNPLGGCLPMALQLPFLYGFYRVLAQAIELRHAPWILWLKDLSAPDNFHVMGYPLPILPILMVVTMFILQKMTPMATADPGQQRMMMLMPLIFGVMFFNFPSGLVLYYLTANVVGIGQQIFINKTMPIQPIVPGPRKSTDEKDTA
ncbi:MAG TPA: membrane protein insertase YidC [Terriglobia bacterium]|nr:membrane protein insertase YidC [Terriglobia bacterium]